MNVFYEFYHIAQKLQKAGIPYALVGGVAMAFYTKPRFTKDIDILIELEHLGFFIKILKEEGYVESARPWKFKKVQLTLHRFLKIKDQDEMIIDILAADNSKYKKIIANAKIAQSDSLGQIRVVSKEDLIRMKKIRNSKLDQADIEALRND